MAETDIQRNVKAVTERIWNAAIRAGRAPEEITLEAASKMNPAEKVREAFAAGVTVFGENRVQELEEKQAQGAYAGAEIHLIGHLQKNKVKYVAGRCDMIESADSAELIALISEKALSRGTVQDILVEVNIGNDAAKSGIDPAELDELLASASGLTGVCVRGLMTVPPISEDLAETVKYFRKMYKLFVDITSKKYDNMNMQFLSMGMSGDFEAAIAEGSNIVRVGSAIFGARHYQRL